MVHPLIPHQEAYGAGKLLRQPRWADASITVR